MGKHYKVPPMSRVPRVPRNLNGPGSDPFLLVEEYGVGSWCPRPSGRGPAEAVVLHWRLHGLAADFGIRLKSAAEVNRLIEMLERHRNDVWPQGEGRP